MVTVFVVQFYCKGPALAPEGVLNQILAVVRIKTNKIPKFMCFERDQKGLHKTEVNFFRRPKTSFELDDIHA